MKILYWTERFHPHVGGVEVLSEQLLIALQRKGYEFCVVTSHSANNLIDIDTFADIPVHRFHFLTALTNNNLPQLIQARRRLEQLKKEFQPDLIHIHFSGPSAWFHWQTAKAWPAPTLVTFHSVPNQLRKAQSLLVNTLQQADWVNTVSAFMLVDLQQLEPLLLTKSSVIYNGVSFGDTTITPLPFAPPNLLCVGRLVQWKGFDVALRALAQLREQFPTITLTIVGDGPARPMLEALTDELNLRKHVCFTGWVSREQLPQQFQKATLVLIPSRSDENLPVVAIEAGLFGRPVVASNLSGFPEVIKEGKTGFLVPVDMPDMFANRIAKLLNDPGLASALGQKAGETIQQRFSLPLCTSAYDRLYQQIQPERG